MDPIFVAIVLLIAAIGLLVAIYFKIKDNSRLEQVLWNMQKSLGDSQQITKEDICRNIVQMDAANNQQLKTLNDLMDKGLSGVRNETEKGLAAVRNELDKGIKEIKGTVDEQLQSTLEKRITASFRTVSTQLEQVYKGLGEMQALASDVGSLKQVLSGVKSRGVLGEYQLKSILSEILTVDQYDENVETVPGSNKRVEFAIRLPGMDENTVYLPIDAKFPMDSYHHLLEAQGTGDKNIIDRANKELEKTLDNEAKDIASKYLSPPYTTSFAIMFLPIEGLYAHAVDSGLIERFQHKYKVNIAGPSTMAAILNSLQLGFRTLAIQKRSSEVWKTLGEVKSEFIVYSEAMEKLQKQLGQVTNKFDSLVNTRANQMMRKLKDVEALPSDDLPSE
ncbi:MAG: DNA recombination protein RmuC [Anaerovibrio sp.]|uniref:DNA recombination protein RmuC n=1 Tax=Anaerovibrio sp. TaxID=1872532 RepID=UPI0025DAC98A|nr:DNA recombination protein RmuC [Anaerovibrio sp.]MCR5176049.1 DNA recombination protein RmuC [Anaerovibrio sp.]